MTTPDANAAALIFASQRDNRIVHTWPTTAIEALDLITALVLADDDTRTADTDDNAIEVRADTWCVVVHVPR